VFILCLYRVFALVARARIRACAARVVESSYALLAVGTGYGSRGGCIGSSRTVSAVPCVDALAAGENVARVASERA